MSQEEHIVPKEQYRNFILYKPHNCHSQFILDNNKKKILLGDLYDFPDGTMLIGRLDKDSEGLLFLTTNGKVSQLVRGRKVEKEYYVQVDGLVNDDQLQRLRDGVTITVEGEPYQTLPCNASRLKSVSLPAGKPIRGDHHGPTSWVSITLREGKFRQVRKMTAAVGCPTLRLVRYRIGQETIRGMQPREVKEVDWFKL